MCVRLRKRRVEREYIRKRKSVHLEDFCLASTGTHSRFGKFNYAKVSRRLTNLKKKSTTFRALTVTGTVSRDFYSPFFKIVTHQDPLLYLYAKVLSHIISIS